ncbi:uncharacterized protein FIBRA_07187 [Fibroporia radiculosa]|uniref:Uncharacterized protein n=1 Tax=Fibroporia radiculosa TaxID=599839 RepID=J4H4H2_9APHY|nr:uncharacterized protein FIBRA_07187 [Fibroporia radiculosa]CCM04989.1 predicted protein [Fibroporia radiculosa]
MLDFKGSVSKSTEDDEEGPISGGIISFIDSFSSNRSWSSASPLEATPSRRPKLHPDDFDEREESSNPDELLLPQTPQSRTLSTKDIVGRRRGSTAGGGTPWRALFSSNKDAPPQLYSTSWLLKQSRLPVASNDCFGRETRVYDDHQRRKVQSDPDASTLGVLSPALFTESLTTSHVRGWRASTRRFDGYIRSTEKTIEPRKLLHESGTNNVYGSLIRSSRSRSVDCSPERSYDWRYTRYPNSRQKDDRSEIMDRTYTRLPYRFTRSTYDLADSLPTMVDRDRPLTTAKNDLARLSSFEQVELSSRSRSRYLFRTSLDHSDEEMQNRRGPKRGINRIARERGSKARRPSSLPDNSKYETILPQVNPYVPSLLNPNRPGYLPLTCPVKRVRSSYDRQAFVQRSRLLCHAGKCGPCWQCKHTSPAKAAWLSNLWDRSLPDTSNSTEWSLDADGDASMYDETETF